VLPAQALSSKDEAAYSSEAGNEVKKKDKISQLRQAA
jgi:hypothetical protein